MSLRNDLPGSRELLKMGPQEIAVLLLAFLNDPQKSAEHRNTDGNFNLSNMVNCSNDFSDYVKDLLPSEQHEIRCIFSEAWAWLQSEGLIARFPDSRASFLYFVTRRGRRIRTRADFQTFKLGNLLPPRESLHAALAEKVAPLFLRGDYDTALFQAFKEVEVAVRTAAKLPDNLIGTALMREAFHPDKGRLSNKQKIIAEREATSALFSGSIGLFKNPSSHRSVEVGPVEAGELIHLANFMLRLVDSAAAEGI